MGGDYGWDSQIDYFPPLHSEYTNNFKFPLPPNLNLSSNFYQEMSSTNRNFVKYIQKLVSNENLVILILLKFLEDFE